jgi:SOS-response transcriptional repressor LexA
VEPNGDDKALSAALKAAFALAKPRRTITQVAPRIGVSYDVLSNVLNGRTKPDSDLVERLRKELGKPKGWPFTDLAQAGRSGNAEGQVVSLAGTPLVEIPVVGKVAAGEGEHNIDPDLKTIWVPEPVARMGGYGWEVEGDSMMPDLYPGDVLVFKERRTPKRGYPMLIRTEDREDRVKIIDWQDGEWQMSSRNQRYPQEPLDGTQLMGLLVGFYRYSRTREIILTDPDGLKLPLFGEEFA